jgi:hypothetical protein
MYESMIMKPSTMYNLIYTNEKENVKTTKEEGNI